MALPRDASGGRRQHRFTFVGTKKEAERAFVAELERIAGGSHVAADRTTVGKYLAEFLEASKPIYAPKTWERYEQMTRTHIVPALGALRLQRLNATNLNLAYAKWLESGLSGQTVLHHHRLIHRALQQAVREGRVQHNVATIASRPRALHHERRVMTSDEVGRVLAAVAGTSLELLVFMAVATGARRGELLGAKWDDVDFNRGTLAIRRSLEQTKTGVREKAPKSGKARSIALPTRAVEALRHHRKAQSRLLPGYVFPGDSAGGPWTPHKVTDGFREVLRKAGIRGASFHTLRHTCASLLLAEGVHPKVVQEMLGHSTIAITMDLYSHVTPSLQAEAANRMDIVLRHVTGSVAI